MCKLLVVSASQKIDNKNNQAKTRSTPANDKEAVVITKDYNKDKTTIKKTKQPNNNITNKNINKMDKDKSTNKNSNESKISTHHDDLRSQILKLKKIDDILHSRYYLGQLGKYNTGAKVHKKQLEFHKSKKKNRWVFGGNRSGKTECGAVEALYMARGVHPYRENKKNVTGWVVSLSTQVQRDVAQNKILYYLDKNWIHDIIMSSGKKTTPELGVIDTIVIKNIFGGLSKIGFKSCDQGREKFQGTSLDFVWFDEEPPYDIYMECKMRVLDNCGDLFGTMTPLKGLSWVYSHIYLNEYSDDEVWHLQMEWADNPFLDSDEIKKYSQTLSEEELQSRKYGNFKESAGIVYSEFDPKIHVIDNFEIPTDWQDTISIDPGLHNPLSAHWYAVDYDGNVYVVAEHYESNKTVEYHAGRLKEISSSLNWRTNSNGMLEALIDSAASQRTLSSEKSVVELFYDYGVLVNTRVNKDVYAGINRVKSYLKNSSGEARLFIFKSCVNLIREFRGYFWGNNDSPIKKDDHALDELRYYIMNRPDIPTKKESKSLLQKNKERLYKNLKMQRGY